MSTKTLHFPTTAGTVSLLFALILLNTVKPQQGQEQWERPDAWSQHKIKNGQYSDTGGNEIDGTVQLPHTTVISNQDNYAFYYTRLVNTLFNVANLKYEDVGDKYYRNLRIELTEAQVDGLTRNKNLQDIDSIVMEVLAKSNEIGYTEFTFNILKSMYSFIGWLITTIGSFTSGCRDSLMSVSFDWTRFHIAFKCCVFAILFFASRRFRFSFVIICLFTGMYFLYDFLHSECLRKEDIRAYANRHNNPCDPNYRVSWWNYYLWGTTESSECQAFLLKNSEPKCSFINLMHEFQDELLFKSFSKFIMNLTELLKNVYVSGGLVIFIVLVWILQSSLIVFIQSIFRDIFGNLIRSGYDKTVNNHPPPITHHPVPINSITNDTIDKILDITKILADKVHSPAKILNGSHMEVIESIELHPSTSLCSNCSPERDKVDSESNGKCVTDSPSESPVKKIEFDTDFEMVSKDTVTITDVNEDDVKVEV